ncbi:MAG: isoprenylcysteine carboxylmethyltransferase family protein [Verrucomicrobia bacterium]|nr:isoprenylcysteine carboxylmethyltransferase family protein [Verrucomicrobiota bacterium]
MTTEELFCRRAITSGFALIYWAGVFVQARRVRRHIGRAPNLKPRGAKEKLLWLGWLLVIAAWMGQGFLVKGGDASFWLRMPAGLLHPLGLVLGIALTLAGYAGTIWCYAIMGDAWRIGIDRSEKNSLVTRGPYRAVRHPIYLFQIVMLAGALLLLPTAVSALTLAVHLLCVLTKAVDEEKYLLTVHGETYRAYLARTGRLFPKFF